MSSWTQILERAEPKEHVVHLYGGDDELLADHVSRYLGEGLRRGDGLLVIATPAHTASITTRLIRDGGDVAAATRAGQLVVLDAAETLASFMIDGKPSRPHFEQVVGKAIDALRERLGHGRVRAFGEMVGLLWCAGQVPAARERHRGSVGASARDVKVTGDGTVVSRFLQPFDVEVRSKTVKIDAAQVSLA